MHVQGDAFLVLLQHRDRQAEADDGEVDRRAVRRQRNHPAALAAALIADAAGARARQLARLLHRRARRPWRGSRSPGYRSRPTRPCRACRRRRRRCLGQGTSAAARRSHARKSFSEPWTSTTTGTLPSPLGITSRPASFTPPSPAKVVSVTSKAIRWPALLSEGDRPGGAVGEGDGLAVRPPRPAIGAVPSPVWTLVQLAGLAGEQAPAQGVAVGGGDIHRPPVRQAIGPDMAISGVHGVNRGMRQKERRQRRQDAKQPLAQNLPFQRRLVRLRSK